MKRNFLTSIRLFVKMKYEQMLMRLVDKADLSWYTTPELQKEADLWFDRYADVIRELDHVYSALIQAGYEKQKLEKKLYFYESKYEEEENEDWLSQFKTRAEYIEWCYWEELDKLFE